MSINLLPSTTITTALTASLSKVTILPSDVASVLIQINFDYGSAGTDIDVHIETSYDGGTTWTEIVQFAGTTADERVVYNLSVLTPVTTQYDATTALGDDAVKDGLIGDRLRVNTTSTGTYAGSTTLVVDAIIRSFSPMRQIR